MGHYDYVAVVPALAWLVLAGGWRRGWRSAQWIRALGVPLLVGAGLLACFYLPFVLDERFAQLRLVSRLPEVVTFEYRCHVHGVDAIPQWVGDGQPCSAASSSYVQGFQVRLAGPSAKYYRVRYECSTVHKDGRGLAKVQGSKAAGDWCGVRDSATEEWVSRMVVWVEPVISF